MDGQFGCFVVGLFNGLMITLWTVGFLIAMMSGCSDRRENMVRKVCV